tara:strand:- start:702 stop:1253 length:552 start_codon:yes stop_codon:yes gene_type:complete
MKERNVDLINLDRIDLIKGRSNVDLNQLSKLLLDNYSNHKELFNLSDRLLANRYEDSYCPPCPLVDSIIEEMIMDFYAATKENIVVTNYWSHIHQKDMSTITHNHIPSYVSSVLYVKIPENAGHIVFNTRSNPYSTPKGSKFEPEEGVYYMFPSFLDHYVTRNMSDDTRISLSFNFDKSECEI